MKNIRLKHPDVLNDSKPSSKLLGYWTYHIKHKSWSLSKDLEQALSVTSVQIENRSLLHLVHPDEQSVVSKQFQVARQNHEPFESFHRMMIKDQYRFVSVKSRADEQDGHLIAYFGTIEDITDDVMSSVESASKIQALEKDIQVLKQTLQDEQNLHRQHDDAKSSFISTMSHEIRTPMNAMIGFTHLLAETELKDEQKEYITRIQDSSKHLLSVINDILDLSKMEAGKMAIEQRRFAIDQMIQEVKDLFSEQAKRKRLYMDFETIHCPNYVIGDVIRIKQVLINLISNALKFTDVGGLSIVISSQFSNPHSALVSFKVKDTGIGMSQAQQDKLFKAYEQASSSTTRLFGGTGLGLSISMRLAKLMNGHISVESKLNEGTTFTLTIPLMLDEREEDVIEDIIITKHYRKHARILVAEDHVLSQKLVERLLTNLEEDVLIVDNGEQALKAMKDQLFDIVFLDMNMPLLDGIGATKAIRRFNTKTPIVALTANAYPEERSQCLLAGMNDVLVKPIDSKSLQEALVKWIPEE
ncbi:MAG: hypothetical protein A2Y45_00020 [Tenericutes bacterium GWC2_34_14]|nr:MAG: hypothetical protein A2Y45_00020 [Tenericutes bacterium GWC2_34_14]OHE34388.1 MAG: hypothetical protein A2012_07640 [Tenericutes bacterium GWE2_34_108]OHE35744.1 MAG: hypothetical protein A2Y46_02345 [Tenericutes bacterium GWF1_35_14]OHE39169.1 MAG: hypothetical protein A2Y44_07585 [Tenericutes bacterium GWF2_35_184]OHE42764.1 MAG: hypothetical protein A2221_08650 [Tenericutes bacterium RIFOXYA2_FULL_36_32]OHE44711.1 MAG: hypothetical protein A3K26_06755 [Tenericutes bacterium RIFOXYA1